MPETSRGDKLLDMRLTSHFVIRSPLEHTPNLSTTDSIYLRHAICGVNSSRAGSLRP